MTETHESGWTADDDKARAIYELRAVMKRHMGINTEGLTDDEVVLIMQRRLTALTDAFRPILEKLQCLGLLPPEER